MQNRRNPPAFPSQYFNGGENNAFAPDGEVVAPLRIHDMHGMSLRDYFAAAALTGLLAAETEAMHYRERALAAEEAYEVADLMLNERAKP